ncbi:NAD(P)H-dependent oxidoreductase [Clostridium sp. HBUAS56010]|uniref:NAD(P)H-dependent oxidoreductase n=1 Tax=Clostridium sp. HBUAS56010 TaxID=2571127 RepID=UPI0011782212|nr:NAD(P)H-dependent oxidoreductase [Clostridium sp. HBUAS56010]
MKTLIIVTHPDIEHSMINKRWIEELSKYPDKFTIHELYKEYPHGNIDIKKEQELVESHDNLIFQFPLFNFSSPPLLKKWLDDVLVHGWAYGRERGDKLKGRKISLAVSAGIQKEDYQPDGKYYYTLEQILAPFKVLFQFYCHSDYRPFFVFYGAEKIPGEEYASTTEEIEKSVKDYLNFISGI